MDLEKIKKENKLTTIEDKGKYIEAIRNDGLTIFLDKSTDRISKFLNNVRLTGTKEQVIMSVGLVRGLQIARNYAKKHNEDLNDFENVIKSYENKFLKD